MEFMLMGFGAGITFGMFMGIVLLVKGILTGGK
jgi:hypothetical protein